MRELASSASCPSNLCPPRFNESLYHCYLHRSIRTQLLQFSLRCNLPKSHISHLQQIQNSLAPADHVKAPYNSCHITPNLRSVHWPIKITERIEYKLLSLAYKVLTTTHPPHLPNILSVQSPRITRSPSLPHQSLSLGHQHHPRYVHT